MIHFEDITEKNIKDVLALSITKTQEPYIESIDECLKEASEYHTWRPKAIYDDDILIGFMMYGMFERVWFDRFLIDMRYQGRGYGKKAAKKALELLKAEYHQDEVYLSVYPSNTLALRLYESLGFKKTGELDTKGEHVMVYRYDEGREI